MFLLLYQLALVCKLHAQPITSAYGEVEVPVAGVTSETNTVLAGSTNNMDAGNFSMFWLDRAQGHTGFGVNRAYAYSSFIYSDSPEVYDPSQASPTVTASYILSWSSLNHSSSGDILNISLSTNGTISGLQLGSFQFQYGTPYIIQSSLSLYASYSSSGHALANSVWSDTFTINGFAEGTIGTAGFGVTLNGSVSSSFTEGPPITFGAYPTTPTSVNVLTADFTDGASLDYIFLPNGSSLVSSPGLTAMVVTPEPSSIGLLALGACGSLWRRTVSYLSKKRPERLVERK